MGEIGYRTSHMSPESIRIRRSPLSRLATGLILAYQRLLSPRLGRNCRFFPSCSEYAKEAILAHGLLRGLSLGMRRLGRCHPLHPGGLDPVPRPRAR
jgi:putative membrane protein insertion efficiency factor